MKPLAIDEWDASLQWVIDDMQGRPLQLHCLLANHPDLLNAWWNYRMHSVRGGDLAQRDCELVILRVAVHMEAWYEWAAHVVRGAAAWPLQLTGLRPSGARYRAVHGKKHVPHFPD